VLAWIEGEEVVMADWTGFREDLSPSSSPRTTVGMRKEMGGGVDEEVE